MCTASAAVPRSAGRDTQWDLRPETRVPRQTPSLALPVVSPSWARLWPLSQGPLCWAPATRAPSLLLNSLGGGPGECPRHAPPSESPKLGRLSVFASQPEPRSRAPPSGPGCPRQPQDGGRCRPVFVRVASPWPQRPARFPDEKTPRRSFSPLRGDKGGRAAWRPPVSAVPASAARRWPPCAPSPPRASSLAQPLGLPVSARAACSLEFGTATPRSSRLFQRPGLLPP